MGKIFREGSNPIWTAFALVYILGAIGYAMYSLFTETGPVMWLGTWQAENLLDGEWYPKLTTLIVILGLLIPMLVLKVVIEKVTGKRLTPPVDWKQQLGR
jgi:hypothetical protein